MIPPPEQRLIQAASALVLGAIEEPGGFWVRKPLFEALRAALKAEERQTGRET